MNEYRFPPAPENRFPCAISRNAPTWVRTPGDHAFDQVAEPTIRWRGPNSEWASSGLLGSPRTGWFCQRTLAISVDLRLFLASVKLYPRLAVAPELKLFRSCAVRLIEWPSLLLSMTYM